MGSPLFEVAAVDIEAGALGEALAATIVDALAEGGWQYDKGRLVRARLGVGRERLRLPDGSTVTTLALPIGELEAARRASGAPAVVSASSELPSGPATRLVFPAAAVFLSFSPLRRTATARMARVRLKRRISTRESSWARARIQWSDGTERIAWMRAGKAMPFTAAVAAEVARRLCDGHGVPGAYTPGGMFGTEIALAAGGEFLDDYPHCAP